MTDTNPEWAGTLARRAAASVMATYVRHPIEVVSGRGCRVTDSSGRERLDFVAGIATNALGHGHPAVAAAIREGADRLLHASNLYWTEPMIRLAERLCAASGMHKAFFCNSGAEAIETAIKVARKARPGRSKIVVFDRSFHGRTMGALSATWQPAYQEPFRPLVPGFEALPYGDFQAVDRGIDDRASAVLVEVVQGEGGLVPAPPGWLAHLRAACDRAGALLILDEVQTGVGRTGHFYACQEDGVVPDAIATAKGLGGGLPIGALLAREPVASVFVPGDHGATFGGSPFVTTVAHAVLDVVLAPGFLEGVREQGQRLGAGLVRLLEKHPSVLKGTRGRGLMQGLALHAPAASELVVILYEEGLLSVPASKDVVRLVPPLIVSAAEIDEALGLLDQGLARFSAARRPA